MSFKLVSAQEANDANSNLDLAYVLNIFPIIIDRVENVAYAVGPNITKGPRILGEAYWNEYSEDMIINQVIMSSQLSNNFKWFINTMLARIKAVQTPPINLQYPLV